MRQSHRSHARHRVLTDAELVAHVRRGSDQAFGELYARYHGPVSALVRGLLKDPAQAEDVAQDAFVAALRRLRETHAPIAFRPWIHQIARNASVDHYRRTRRTVQVPLDADAGLSGADQARLAPGPSHLGPEQAHAQNAAMRDLRGALGGLNDQQRQVLVLRELEGRSYMEIADKVGMTRQGVESTLFRARRRLGEEYDAIASGQRCGAVQGLIAGQTGAPLKQRERHKVAVHLSHCQPCRREAHRPVARFSAG